MSISAVRPSRHPHSLLFAALLLTTVVSAGATTIADIEAEETPLHWAAEHGLYSIASQLIANGADVNAPDQFGRTPLHFAVRYADLVALLLASGAEVNAADMFDRTPLHAALQYPFSVAALLDAGADIDAEDYLGDTPLERTLRYGTRSRNIAVIQMLLDEGAGASRASR